MLEHLSYLPKDISLPKDKENRRFLKKMVLKHAHYIKSNIIAALESNFTKLAFDGRIRSDISIIQFPKRTAFKVTTVALATRYTQFYYNNTFINFTFSHCSVFKYER